MADEVFNIDLNDTSDVGAPEFRPLPRGEYPLTIMKKPEVKRATSGDQSPMLSNIQLKVDAGDEKTHYVWRNVVIHPNTVKDVKAFLLSFGYRSKNFTSQELWSEDFAEDLVGREGRALIDVEDKKDAEGNITGKRNVVKYWLSEFSRQNTTETNPPLLTDNPDEMPF